MDDFEDFGTPPPERVRPIRTYNLTPEQEKDLKQAFTLFDEDEKEIISIELLSQLMRAVAHHPTEKELADYAEEYDPDGTGEITLNEFFAIMSDRYKDMTPEDEVILAFRVFDAHGNGFISESEFRHIMGNLGDKLTEEELDDIMLDADANTESNIDYVAFVKMMQER